MRRILLPALLALLAATAIAGCGSSSSHTQKPVTTELSYFPTNSPFVLTVATDPNASSVQSAQGLLGRFPEAALGIDALEGKLSSIGLSYDSDIKPLFGNPIALGLASGSSYSTSSAQNDFLAVWVTKSASALKSLISKLLHGAPSAGTHDGASVYQLGTVTLALDGATAIVGTTSSVTAALDRHASSDGFTPAEFASDTTGLPQSTVMEAFGNLTGVLSQPSAAKARLVPWVAAIRGYAAAISASSAGVNFQYRIDTSGASLTSSQVPIAAGTTAPSLAGSAPIVVGIKDPAQIVAFAEAAEQATSPASYEKFQAKQANLKTKTGIDVNSLASLLTGDLIIDTDTHTTIGRVTVSDPSTAASVLAKLAGAPQGLFKRGVSVAKLGGGFYAIKEPKLTITVGLVGNQLVAGKATPAQDSAFAAAPATPAGFARGSVAFQIALPDLLKLALKQQPPAIVQTLLNQLGDVTGWTAASPSALTGSATLAIK
jgi:hypothetical protein